MPAERPNLVMECFLCLRPFNIISYNANLVTEDATFVCIDCFDEYYENYNSDSEDEGYDADADNTPSYAPPPISSLP